jgi:hypothetical protein
LIGAPPRNLTSRFQVTHGMLLNVLSRKGDGCRAMQQLIARLPRYAPTKTGAHQTRVAIVPLAVGAQDRGDHPSRRADASAARRNFVADMQQSFVQPRAGAKIRVNVELQDDFSMDQALSLYLLETIPLMVNRRASRTTRSCC